MAVNDASASSSFTTPSPTANDSGKNKKREVGVAEAWTNEKKKREVTERGNGDIILRIPLIEQFTVIPQKRLSWRVSITSGIQRDILSPTLSLTSGVVSPNTGSSSWQPAPGVHLRGHRGF